MYARFEQQEICIYMPAAWQKSWYESDRVGFNQHLKNPDGSSLYLLVEKDFVCLDETVEDQSDNYPNPKADLLK